MQIDWNTISLWVLFWLVGHLMGLVIGYFMGQANGAKNYGMIAGHLKRLLNESAGTDAALKQIEELADAIRKGSE